MARFILTVIVLLGVAIPPSAHSTEFKLPPFLPEYYTPAFEINGARLLPVENKETNGVEQYIYSTVDHKYILSIERIQCDSPRCLVLFNNIQGYLSKEGKGKDGEVLDVTKGDFSARIFEQGAERSIFSFILPGATIIWTYSATTKALQLRDRFKLIQSCVNRQRYEKSLNDNVEMGAWGPQFLEYARQLMQEGKKQEALTVLRNIVKTSPYNFDAHMDLIGITDDANEARNSAKIVFKNSEDPHFLTEAAKLLKIQETGADAIPLLSTKDTGLQLILIPLSPCNIQFLQDAARIYEQITRIPVAVRRIKNDWLLGPPDRIFRQRDVQAFLTQEMKSKENYIGWDKQRYIKALQEAADSQNPIIAYQIRKLVENIEKEPGQYQADSYVDWFSKELKSYRSTDFRTMYVGVTEANIFSGDNNYLFSFFGGQAGQQASILSYKMMMAKTLSAEYESRSRLAERIAKELVPASLKTLAITRSTDPKCPYSYSSGVDRLDQKGLVLSEQVENDLNRFR